MSWNRSPLYLSLRALCVLVWWFSVHCSPVSISNSYVVYCPAQLQTRSFVRQQRHLHFSKYFKWLCLTIFHGILLGKKKDEALPNISGRLPVVERNVLWSSLWLPCWTVHFLVTRLKFCWSACSPAPKVSVQCIFLFSTWILYLFSFHFFI
jgi:hypothetical protein